MGLRKKLGKLEHSKKKIRRHLLNHPENGSLKGRIGLSTHKACDFLGEALYKMQFLTKSLEFEILFRLRSAVLENSSWMGLSCMRSAQGGSKVWFWKFAKNPGQNQYLSGGDSLKFNFKKLLQNINFSYFDSINFHQNNQKLCFKTFSHKK